MVLANLGTPSGDHSMLKLLQRLVLVTSKLTSALTNSKFESKTFTQFERKELIRNVLPKRLFDF
jgi:hypothetical protein